MQGESGAKSYLVAPNCTVQLWDSESNTIYLKSADASGMPSIKILDYTIRNNDNEKTKVDSYQNKIENCGSLETKINNINNKISEIEKEIDQMKSTMSNKNQNC